MWILGRHYGLAARMTEVSFLKILPAMSVETPETGMNTFCGFLWHAIINKTGTGLGPGPSWGPYGPIGVLWAHKGP